MAQHSHFLRHCACTVAAILALSAARAVHAGTPDLEGQPAPDFALRSLGAANLRLSEYLGQVVMLNFWATWCGPCRQEMPLLDELYNKYRRAGFVLLSINVDDAGERATEMVETLKVTYPVLLDERKAVSRAYEVANMPVTVLIDREGVVRFVSEGYRPGYEQRYADALRELLNE